MFIRLNGTNSDHETNHFTVVVTLNAQNEAHCGGHHYCHHMVWPLLKLVSKPGALPEAFDKCYTILGNANTSVSPHIV